MLNYLAENFRTKNCEKMCDNCNKGLKVAEGDFTEYAKTMVNYIEALYNKTTELTITQISQFLRGKSV